MIIDDFLGRDAAISVATEAKSYKGLRPAGMSRGLGRWAASNKRGDETAWLKRDALEATARGGTCAGGDLECGAAALLGFLDQMESLRAELADTWGLGNGSINARGGRRLNLGEKMTHQLARYPGDGTGYVRHRDANTTAGMNVDEAVVFPEFSPSRQLTAIYYVNKDWTVDACGQLRLFLSHPASSCTAIPIARRAFVPGVSKREIYWDVEPVLDRLVIFRSDRVDHEVLSAYRERFAITTWMYGSMWGTCDGDGHNVACGGIAAAMRSTSRAKDEEKCTSVQPCPCACPLQADDKPIFFTKEHPLHHLSLQSPAGRRELLSATAGRVSLSIPTLLGSLLSPPSSSIFVSIASFRDSECQHTIADLFATASDASRIYVGVVGQYDYHAKARSGFTQRPCESPLSTAYKVDDADCFTASPLTTTWAQRVRCLNLDWRDAEGPCWARHLAQKLWRGEEYVLQIDSHMRFRPNWDAYLISFLRRVEGVGVHNEEAFGPSRRGANGAAANTVQPVAKAGKRKVVLTTYPLGYTLNPTTVSNDTRPTLLVPAEVGGRSGDGMLRQTGRLVQGAPSAPIPSLLWAAGFNFSRANETILKCPYDPHLPFLFFGEEISIAARLWTHGFDLFAPPEAVLYHLWSRAHRPVFQDAAVAPDRAVRKKRSQQRVRYILGMELHQCGLGKDLHHLIELHRYGLGKERSLQSYEEALGVCFGDDNGILGCDSVHRTMKYAGLHFNEG